MNARGQYGNRTFIGAEPSASKAIWTTPIVVGLLVGGAAFLAGRHAGKIKETARGVRSVVREDRHGMTQGTRLHSLEPGFERVRNLERVRGGVRY